MDYYTGEVKEVFRKSYSDIGKETGISRVAVKARIQALEKPVSYTHLPFESHLTTYSHF